MEGSVIPAHYRLNERTRHYVLGAILLLLAASAFVFFRFYDAQARHGGASSLFICVALLLNHLSRYYVRTGAAGRVFKYLSLEWLVVAAIFVVGAVAGQWPG